jgi:N-acetylneuraminic acid mutarotase
MDNTWSEVKFSTNKKPKCSSYSVVKHKNHIYVFGGYNENNNQAHEQFLKYDLILKEWMSIKITENKPKALMGHSACIFEDEMVIYGGWNGTGMNDVWNFNFEEIQWTKQEVQHFVEFEDLWISEGLPAKYYHSSVVYQDSIFFIFGFLSDSRTRTNELAKYNPKEGKSYEVASLGDLPLGRSGVTAIVYSDHLFVYGGFGENGVRFNDLYSFNIETNVWKYIDTTGELPVKTSGQCGIKYGSSIFIFGGSFGGGGSGSFLSSELTYTNNLYKYDLTSQVWKKLKNSNSPGPRSFCEAFIHDDEFYM